MRSRGVDLRTTRPIALQIGQCCVRPASRISRSTTLAPASPFKRNPLRTFVCLEKTPLYPKCISPDLPQPFSSKWMMPKHQMDDAKAHGTWVN
jgi:hypothetical protein